MAEYIIVEEGLLLVGAYSANVGPMFELQTGPTTSPRLMSLTIASPYGLNSFAVAYGLGYSGAAGVGIRSHTPVPLDPSSPACNGVTGYSTWLTKPTVPAKFYRRHIGFCSQVSNVWGFPRGFTIPVNSSLVLWAFSGGGFGGVADVFSITLEITA